ncbi:MAG: MFS transporter [Myxococcales bacterium]
MHQKSLVALYLTVFIDLLGFGIVLPLLPFYAEHYGATGVWVGALMAAYSAAQFLGAPLLGRLSDRYGRRPLLLLSLAGSALSLALSGVASSLSVLIAARALAGLFGGSIATAQAYVADVTSEEERAKYLGLLGASIGLGFVFGPALGAALSRFGFGAAAFASAGLAAANFVFAALVLREPERRRTPGRASLAGLGAAVRTAEIGRIALSMFLSTLAFVGMEATFALLGERRLGLDSSKLGLVFTFIGVVMVVMQGGVVGRLAPKVGERALATVGAVLMAAGLLALPFAPHLPLAMALLATLAAGQALLSPTVAALLSRASARDAQGGTLGIGQSVSALARAVGPLVAGWLFDRSMAMPYAAGAIALLLAAALLGTMRPPAPQTVATAPAEG